MNNLFAVEEDSNIQEKAVEYAEAIYAMIDAQTKLTSAKKACSKYNLGQYDSNYICKDELDAYYKACNNLYKLK